MGWEKIIEKPMKFPSKGADSVSATDVRSERDTRKQVDDDRSVAPRAGGIASDVKW
jgi:hypothetical protein